MENLKLNGISLEDLGSVPYWAFQVRDLDDMLDNMNPDEVYAILNGLRNHIRYGQEPELNDRFAVSVYRNLIDGMTGVASSFIKRRNQGIKNLQARNEKKKNAGDKKIVNCNVTEETDRDYIDTIRKEFPNELSFILRTLNDQEKRDERNEKYKTINYKLSATDQEKKEFKDFLTKYREKLLEEENKQQIYSELGVERRDEQPIEFQKPSLKKVGHITTLSKYDQVIKDNYTAYDTLKHKYGTEDSLLIESIVNRILRSLDSEEDKNRFRGELESFKEKNTKAAE